MSVSVRSRLMVAAAAACALTCALATARAEEPKAGEGRLPVSYPERPLTLPRMILNIEGELGVDRLGDLTQGAFTYVNLPLSARFGITDDLEAYAVFAPLEFGPFTSADVPGSKVHYANPSLGATYRFLRGKFEIGATLGFTIVHEAYDDVWAVPVPADTGGVIIEPGGVFKLHIGHIASLEGGVFLPIEAGSTSGVGLRIPLAFAIDITEPLHVGARSGVGLSSFATPPDGQSAGENLYVPFGVFGGYAIAGKNGPILDIDGFFNWPHLFTPSTYQTNGQPGQSVNGGDFSIGVSLGGFVYL